MNSLLKSFPVAMLHNDIMKEFGLRELSLPGIGCYRLIDSTNNIMFSISILGNSMAIFIRKDDTYQQHSNINDSNFYELFGNLYKCNDVNPIIELDNITEYIREIMNVVQNLLPGASIKDALEDVLRENNFY